MSRSSRLWVPAVVAASALVGWLAGSGRLESVLNAKGDPPKVDRPAAPATPPVQLVQAEKKDPAPAGKDGKKPNILVIWGDDIGWFNVSAYNHGLMGYKTPNIDRIAKEGAMFTDWYGQQSCTAGRACFITGQNGFRTGLLKVGLPGAKKGFRRET